MLVKKYKVNVVYAINVHQSNDPIQTFTDVMCHISMLNVWLIHPSLQEAYL